jgi:hypothetical protein
LFHLRTLLLSVSLFLSCSSPAAPIPSGQSPGDSCSAPGQKLCSTLGGQHIVLGCVAQVWQVFEGCLDGATCSFGPDGAPRCSQDSAAADIVTVDIYSQDKGTDASGVLDVPVAQPDSTAVTDSHSDTTLHGQDSAKLDASTVDTSLVDVGADVAPALDVPPQDVGGQEVSTPCVIGELCDDGEPCTGPDICLVTGKCKGTAFSCDDKNKCTIDVCNSKGKCQSSMAPETHPCGTNLVCGWSGWCDKCADPSKNYPNCGP